MNKFARPKTYREIKRQCEQQGVPLNDYQYRANGWDTIVVGDQLDKTKGYVVYNTFNGRFFGEAPWPQYSTDSGKPIRFSESSKLDGTPWFDALLAFFYVEKT